MQKNSVKLKKLSIPLLILALMMLVGGCTVLPRYNNVTICNNVHFDYGDNFNDHNVKEMLKFYCLCVDRSVCD